MSPPKALTVVGIGKDRGRCGGRPAPNSPALAWNDELLPVLFDTEVKEELALAVNVDNDGADGSGGPLGDDP